MAPTGRVLGCPCQLPGGQRPRAQLTPPRAPALERMVAEVARLTIHRQPRGGVRWIVVEMTGGEHHTIEAIARTHCQRAMQHPTPGTAPASSHLGYTAA